MPVATTFVGRTAELAVLDDALARLDDGAAGALEVIGPAGIGKTRLLAELAAKADTRGQLVLTGAGAELEQDLPFWIFVDALDEYVEGLEPRRLERLEPSVRAELAQVLPALAGTPDAPAAALHERYRTHRAMRELLEQLAATRPLVLILDDVHWADQASLDLLMALLHRPPAAGVLFTFAARPRQLPERLATALDRARREGRLSCVELTPLSRDEARTLVGADADALYDETGGNPFFLEQLSRAPAGAPASAADDVTLAGVHVPPMVAAALTEELRLLSPATRRALDGAAVAGDPFEVDLAAIAADLREADMLDALDELVAGDFARATDLPRRFRFRHPIVRRAVYEATPGGWRLGAHERVAAALAARGASATARAHHVERSARQGDAAAAAVLAEAGRESALRAPATAARLFAAALGLLPPTAPDDARVELLLPMGQSQAATGDFTAARETLLECLELVPASERALRTQLTAMCARVEHLLGMHEQAHERLVGALDELPEHACDHCVSLMVELSTDPLHRMNYAAMPRWGDRAAELSGQSSDDTIRAVALAVAARGAAMAGDMVKAATRREQAARIVDDLPDAELARRLDAAMYLTGADFYLHRLADCDAHSERVLRVGRATGQGQLFPLVSSTLGLSRFLLGRVRDAIDPLDAAVEAARLTGNAQALAWSLYPRAQIALVMGDVAQALTLAQEACDVVDDGRPNHHFAHAAFALAEAFLESGKPADAVELLERSAGGPEGRLLAPSFKPFALELLTRCRLAVGDIDGAERAAGVAVETASATGLPLARAWADRALAAVALARGDATHAAALALGSADGAAGAGAPIEAARSRALAGRALAAAGNRDGGVEQLRRAAAELEGLGALRYRDAAERDLRQLGERIHRRSQPAGDSAGVGGLTPRELEIARRIVDRRTNRQIAEELFLSPKTVETHVRNIFAKLGADSRVEVARIVERADRLALASDPGRG